MRVDDVASKIRRSLKNGEGKAIVKIAADMYTAGTAG